MATENGPKRDVSPEKQSFPDKKKGESFNEAMNDPNTPTMGGDDKVTLPYNVTDSYTDGNNSCDD